MIKILCIKTSFFLFYYLVYGIFELHINQKYKLLNFYEYEKN